MEIYKDRFSLSGFRLEVPPSLDCPFSHVGEYLLAKETTVHEHLHQTWELILQVEGKTSWFDGRKQIEIHEGDLLICPPGLVHGKNRRETSEFRFYFLGCRMDSDLWPELRHHLSNRWMTRLSHAQELARSFKIVEEELLFEQPRRNDGLGLAWKQLWLTIYRLAANPQRVWNRQQKWLAQRVRTLVESNPGERWTLPAIARLMGYAPNYFAERFRRESGVSFHQYLIGLRLEAATKALEMEEETVTEIALRLGFSSSQHFSRVFAGRMGIMPSRWAARGTPKLPCPG